MLATLGTIASNSYPLEIKKIHPDIVVTGEPCPMWVPLVENDEHRSAGADYFVKKRIDNLLHKDPQIDAVILGCTHYPLLLDKIREYTPSHVKIVSQGEYVANSLKDYLSRHRELDSLCSKGGTCRFLTTENAEKFNESASILLSHDVISEKVVLD